MKKTKKYNSILGEFTTKGYTGRAQERARRRRSPWNLILIPLVILGVSVFSVGQFLLLWQLHIWVFPVHAGRVKEILNSAEGGISGFLMLIPPLISAIPLGFMLANCMVWCVPPARHTLDREARGHWHASFRDSTADIGKLALFIVPICLALGVIGAFTLRSPK